MRPAVCHTAACRSADPAWRASNTLSTISSILLPQQLIRRRIVVKGWTPKYGGQNGYPLPCS